MKQDFNFNYCGIVDNRVSHLVETNILAETEESFPIPALLKCVAYMNHQLNVIKLLWLEVIILSRDLCTIKYKYF